MLESFTYNDLVTQHDLFDLAVNLMVNNVMEEGQDEEIVKGVLTSWWENAKAKPLDSGERFVTYQNAYVEARHKRKFRESDLAEIVEPDWPDCNLPKSFVHLVGKIQGQRDRARMEQLRKFYEEQGKENEG